MNRRILVLIAAAALAVVTPAAGQEAEPAQGPAEVRSLSLEECVALGLANSKALHASEAEAEASAARSREAEAAKLPWLRLFAGYTRLSEVPPFEVRLPFPPGLPFALPDRIIVSPNYYDNFSFRLGVQQPVFTGGRLRAGAEAAKLDAGAARYDLEKDRNELLYALRSSYWSLYGVMEVERALGEGVRRAEAHLADVRNFFEQGLLTRNDVLRAEVRLSQARLARLDTATAVDAAAVRLNSLTGLPLDTEVRPTTRPEEAGPSEAGPPSESGEVDALVGRAFERRPELKSLDLRVKAGQAGVTVARAGRYPQVLLTGNYYDLRPNPRVLPARDKFYSTWDVGVTLSMDLWDWGAVAGRTRQAKARLAQAEDALGLIRDGVAVEVRQARLELGRARERIAVAREAAAQAAENLRVAGERFREGVALNADVIDAQVTSAEAETALTRSLVELELARARMRRALGE